MRWSVPDGTRDKATGLLIHDDYITTDALTSVLDEMDWFVSTETEIVNALDPIEEMSRTF